MANTRSKVFRLSHSKRFLWRMAIGIILLGIFAGWAVHRYTGGVTVPMPEISFGDISFSEEDFVNQLNDTLTESLENPELSFTQKLDVLAASSEMDTPLDMEAIAEKAGFSKSQVEIAEALLQSLGSDQNEPGEALMKLAEKRPLIPDANYALALFWMSVDRVRMAAEAFEEEGTLASAEEARQRAVYAYLDIEDFAALDRLYETPEYHELLSGIMPSVRFDQAIKDRDWPRIIRWLVPSQYAGVAWPIYLVVLIVGAAWFTFLLHTIRAWWDWKLLLLCVIAVLLGAMSTWATILTIVWQHDFLGFERGEDVIGGLLYYIAGVGLREELLKLLFFLPLVPFLVRRKNRLEMLIVAGCVGLGFAIEENISYFHMTDAMSGPGRFLTANFLHVSMTGLIGLAFCQLVMDRGRSIDNFATVFGLIVFAHGLYNALISIPQFGELSFFGMVIYALLCLQMFRVLNYYRGTAAVTLSLTCVFTAGLSVVLATVLGYQISQLGLQPGFTMMMGSIIGLGVIIIMFFLQIDEAIQD
ncbi:PrsW family glutamic-type intramembrane protease [Rubellicoccus peritrichatus]|uniref:PrsW family glutamic-type intramembrane protease n=1 Tax=Rubellicoccus peritrichatus TaxID=3080537 RepID=A0AAQ3LIS9_9BACT|nr:PrsW family glutamic-type intramembrane protease [Puniceicoccus sp. CR14]WOO42904.1 PrsW family glutamic-type intramembrane protease [Puniceicoccus sp. CR14]